MGKLIALLTTHGNSVLQTKLQVLVAEIQATLPGELYPVDSTHLGFQFLALHFGWYNKFFESVRVPFF